MAGTTLHFDTLIIGSGLAGLSAALRLADDGSVAILTKGVLRDGASRWAQGGIAAVMDAQDSLEAHVQDTLVAGAGLCDEAATRVVVNAAPEAIQWLQSMHVPFTQEDGQLHLTREGGHSHRRIVHSVDATGAAVQDTLIQAVLSHPRIQIFEHHILVDLVTQTDADDTRRCVGLYALDIAADTVQSFSGDNTILATGGAGKVYLYTSNPDTATGDGIAAAWRAGCEVVNMEFIQFHPTCLYHPQAKSFLISEALRGEGAQLILPPSLGSKRFMPEHDARAELAPRDIVARAIDFEMKKHGIESVFLDISFKGSAFILEHFPTIHARCLELGIDITREPIPVVPAAHYTCGGVRVNLHGQTRIAHLYAIGETACTGLHGANRLASNSLLECLVFAQNCARAIRQGPRQAVAALRAWDESRVSDADEAIVITHNWQELRRFMWNYVGIVRTNKRLERAAHRIALLMGEVQEFYARFRLTQDLIELRNLLVVADLIVRSAQSRHESRGLHFNLDYPDTAATAADTVRPGKL
jgi:L-aspartate oxidase